MKPTFVIGCVLLIAVVAAVVVMALNSRAALSGRDLSSNAVERPRAGLGSDDAATSSLPASLAGATSSMSNDQRIEEYEFLATCAKFRRLKTGVEIMKDDPLSWINNAETLASLSPNQLHEIEKTVAFVEANTGNCEVTPPDDTTRSELYQAALAAGTAGNLQAAKCYVLAPWPTSVGGDAPPRQLQDEYIANVHQMIDVGLKGGDWGMVNLLIGTYAATTHGLPAIALPNDPAKAYGFQYLQRLGATGDLVQRADQSLAALEVRISPGQKLDQEAWAAETYASFFSQYPVAHDQIGCDW